MLDPYVYPSSEILKNKFNIVSEQDLKEMEAEYTSLRIRELVEKPIKGDFDFQHFCSIHKYIFQDMYDWAGCHRTVDIEKSEPSLGGLSIEYENVEQIETAAERILNTLKSRLWETLSIDERAQRFSEDMAALWKVHGFREGNTRTTVIFFCDFAESRGIALDRGLFEKHSAYVRTALVAASARFMDLGDLSKPKYLINIVKDSLNRGVELSRTMSMDEWKRRIASEKLNQQDVQEKKPLTKGRDSTR